MSMKLHLKYNKKLYFKNKKIFFYTFKIYFFNYNNYMSKRKTYKIKLADIFYCLLFLATILYFSINIFVGKKTKTKQLIIESGKNIWYYQLDKNREVKIEGILGDSTIEIKDGLVLFKDSPCPNKLCVLSNSISKNGDWIACLPNGVFARIEGDDDKNSQIDILSY